MYESKYYLTYRMQILTINRLMMSWPMKRRSRYPDQQIYRRVKISKMYSRYLMTILWPDLRKRTLTDSCLMAWKNGMQTDRKWPSKTLKRFLKPFEKPLKRMSKIIKRFPQVIKWFPKLFKQMSKNGDKTFKWIET